MTLKRCMAALLSVILLLGLFGCGSKETEKPQATPQATPEAKAPSLEELAKKEGKVTVLSPSKGDVMTKIGEGFKAKYGIEVENIYMGSTQIINKIRAEKDNPTGDVWIGAGGIIPFLVAKKDGLLDPYEIKGYKYPEKAGEIVLRDSEHYFSGAWVLTLGWGYNTTKVKPADVPNDFTGFLDPKWKNQVEMADPAASGTAVLFIMSEILKYKAAGKTEDQAWADLAKFAAQVKRFPESGGGPSQDASKGDILVGMAFDQQTYLLKAKKETIDWVLPNNTPVLIDPMGLVKKGPHPNAGKLFMEYVASTEVQQIIATDGPYLPVRSDVKLNPVFNHTFDDYSKKAMKLDLAWLAENFDRVQQKWRTDIATKK
ncbi:MAG TPA: extracellular solute-binding protein [Symbiobacteriaceae bacterium]|nr:extracellular solute-binding protein [Symbiobacteriaceae bacterium]